MVTAQGETERYDGLDVVRAAAMLLGVVYHAAYAYVPGIGPWYFVADVSSSAGFVALVGVLHSFRLELFFTLSGFFSHLVWQRRGPGGFLADRARRLLVPFAAALPLASVADLLLRRLSQAWGLMSEDYAGGVEWKPWSLHLWFLEYLFLYCAGAWAVAGRRAVAASTPKPIALVMRFPEVLLLLGVPLGMGLRWGAELRPAAALLPQAHAFLHYGLFFVLGWALWRGRGAMEALLRRGWWMAAAGFLLALFVFTRPLQWEPLGRFVAGFIPLLLTLGCLSLAFRVRQARRPALRFVVESSYWVYLIHFPLVQALQVLLAERPWPALAKYTAVVALTYALSLGSFWALVRRSALGPWLGVSRSSRHS